ncbi:hypothetical protein U91I_02397 [alpha proteobacterium U9-1i]|nr:hypothetical protein U91I_02397 [alpha proteobacterium U9-1i]
MVPKAMMAALMVMAALGAQATAKSLALTAAEARSELFGVELVGVVEGDETPWRECIAPDGTTLYEIEERVDAGRLTITADGQACFSYASSNYDRTSCWGVSRDGDDNYRFSTAASPDFVTRIVRRDVARCEPRGRALIG